MKGNKISIEWTIYDVLDCANIYYGDDLSMSENDARVILEEIEAEHDPDVGVTWNTIRNGIHHFWMKTKNLA